MLGARNSFIYFYTPLAKYNPTIPNLLKHHRFLRFYNRLLMQYLNWDGVLDKKEKFEGKVYRLFVRLWGFLQF